MEILLNYEHASMVLGIPPDVKAVNLKFNLTGTPYL